MGVDDTEDDPIETWDEVVSEEVVSADPSHLYTMDGKRRSKSLTLAGSIEREKVTILVDTGSSHDFLHPRIAEKLHLPLTAFKPFRVYVGNGESLLCSHMSKATPVVMQGTSFFIDLHILSVHGPNIVLGREWLESLGRVTTDFVQKSTKFLKDDELIVLRGVTHQPKRISLSSLALFVTKASLFELYELIATPAAPDGDTPMAATDFPADLPAAVRSVLQTHSRYSSYRRVFRMPDNSTIGFIFYHRQNRSTSVRTDTRTFRKMR